MRVLLVALILLPLSGCIGGVGIIESQLFEYIEVERGDPTPVSLENCDALLDSLNLRAQQHALVSLHQSYENMHRPLFRGGDVAMEESAESPNDGGAAPAEFKDEPEVTGTNVQEFGVDEADILKTDGTWTYAVYGQTLYIMESNGVGNLSLHSTVQLPGGWGSQLLLIDRGTEDDSDDRLLVIMDGVMSPENAKRTPGDESDSSEDIIYEPYYYGGTHSLVQVYDLSDRKEPQIIQQHSIEGSHVGARLVNGIAYLVIHQYANYLDLRTYAYVDDELLKEEGLTWDEYYQLGPAGQQELQLKSVERAIQHNDEVLADATLADHLPSIHHATTGNFSQVPTDGNCDSVLTTPDDMSRSVSTILSVDVASDDIESQTLQMLGAYPLLYGAQDALVLASSSQEFWWFWAQPDLDEATNLHWFDLDGLDVTHRASGRVEGIVQDQFGIDVHNDQLRIATTTGTWGRWWLEDPDPMQNHLFVFDEVAGQLVAAGSVTGFAETERIWSIRFTDDRAYVVTFEQIDPLWIIDLTDPSNPTILGELEIPGVSTYIHPLPGEEALLSIGIGPPEGEEQGLDWSRIQVSLFDISDPNNPTRAAVYDVSLPKASNSEGEESYSWGYSGALHEHKAFTYWHKLGMLSIPVSWNHYERSCTTEGSSRTCTETQEFHTGLDLIDVDLDAMQLNHYGSVDQDHMMTQEGNEYGYYYGAEVQRSYFLGYPDEYPDKPVSVYAYSTIGMSAHDLATLEDQSSVQFQTEHSQGGCGSQRILCEVTEPAVFA